MKLIVGIGNPGRAYRRTRHNLGFRVVDLLAERFGIECRKRRFRARIGFGAIGGEPVMLLKPQTFVNASGEAVGPARGWHRLALEDVLVVCDDFALPLGLLRLRRGGSNGGHKGLRSVAQTLGTDDYPRLRLGIGREGEDCDRDFVLARFEADELPVVERMVARAAESAVVWAEQGIDASMGKTNRRERLAPPEASEEEMH